MMRPHDAAGGASRVDPCKLLEDALAKHKGKEKAPGQSGAAAQKPVVHARDATWRLLRFLSGEGDGTVVRRCGGEGEGGCWRAR
jgi:hypothetical protein